MGWVVLVIVTPMLPGGAGAFLYGFGSYICHQLPDRSFHLAGFQLPVCARCTGIYAGLAGGAAVQWMRQGRWPDVLAASPRVLRRLAILSAAPTIVTVALETAGAWFPSNGARALAGLPLGILVGVVVMSTAATLHYDECVPPRPTVPKPPPRSI
jgi:uncharacterized membrane protein